MADSFYCYCFFISYIFFYVSFFFAFLVCTAIQDDNDGCHKLKQFGIAQTIMEIFVAALLFLIPAVGMNWFTIVWFLLTTILEIVGFLIIIFKYQSIYRQSQCPQALESLLEVYLYINLAPTIITLIVLGYLCCGSRSNQVQPSDPQTKQYVRVFDGLVPQYSWVRVK